MEVDPKITSDLAAMMALIAGTDDNAREYKVRTTIELEAEPGCDFIDTHHDGPKGDG